VPRGCLGVSSVQLVQSANVSKRKSEGQTGAIAPHWSLIAWSPGRLVAWSLIAPHLMLPSMMTDMRVTSTFSLSLQEEGGHEGGLEGVGRALVVLKRGALSVGRARSYFSS
jgi:hypothetical protein